MILGVKFARRITAMETRHPHLTTQKSFYVEISPARDRAELVTDDAAELRAQLQAVTGERIAALEGIGEMPRDGTSKGIETPETVAGQELECAGTIPKEREAAVPEREKVGGMEQEL